MGHWTSQSVLSMIGFVVVLTWQTFYIAVHLNSITRKIYWQIEKCRI